MRTVLIALLVAVVAFFVLSFIVGGQLAQTIAVLGLIGAAAYAIWRRAADKASR